MVVSRLSALRTYSDFVVLPHSVFALPFAFAALLLAARANQAALSPLTVLLIVLCVVCARTAAMAFNRLVDSDIDAKNPRTAGRHLPSGAVTPASARRLVVLSSAGFFGGAALLGSHCLVLAPLVLGVLFGYSYTKRFTAASHAFLGLALALAPGGAWWVLRPEIEGTPLVLMGAVLLWVAGFDILYSCQDYEFDTENGLHSIPATLGIRRALLLSTVLHVGAFLLFIGVGVVANLAAPYYWFMLPLGALLIGQHALLRPDDLRLVNRAFFTFNGGVSIAYVLIIWWIGS
ncbi:MAG: putative 4-hydroxybenzoate polyprenyltransferase [Bdellovibrionales bacterium]|nr:putative 4-hydroxybenzoate polyprenyltransferase [Bdellovibrionales bacterium]